MTTSQDLTERDRDEAREHHHHEAISGRSRPGSGRRRRWPTWAPYAAAVWAVLVAGLAVVCTTTGAWYPLATDPDSSASVLVGLPAGLGSVLLLCVAVLAAVLSALVARGHLMGWGNRPAAAVLVVLAIPLLFLVPDNNLLVMLGYAPIFLLGAPFGWPPVNYLDNVTWPLVFQLISVIGGLLLVATALVLRRRARRSCPSCGRCALPPRWTTAESAAIWGRWAVLVAVVPPLLYAMDRWAWAAGIPLGISQDFLDDMHRTGLVWAGFGLGTFAFLGAVLTLGLVQHWGEVFPRWILGLGGRRVPPLLAEIPATTVAIFIMSAAVPIVESGARIARNGGEDSLGWLQSAILGSFPIWASALGAATLAYHLRRRGTCLTCHRG